MQPSDLQIEKLRKFTGHAASVFTVAEGLHENSFLSGAGDGLVAEWYLDGDDQAKGIIQIPANIFSLCLIRTLNILLAGHMRGGVHVVDLHQKKEINNLGRTTASVFDLYWHVQKAQLFVATGNGQVFIWKLPSYELHQIMSVSTESVRHIEFFAKKNELAFACSDNNIYIYDADDLSHKYTLTGHTKSVFSLAYSPDGNHLLSGSRDAQLGIWDTEKYTLQQMVPAHMYTINDIKYSPDHKLFATAGRDKHVKIWDAADFRLLKVIDAEKYGGHIHSVNKLFWSVYNNTLISCGDDKVINCWNLHITN